MSLEDEVPVEGMVLPLGPVQLYSLAGATQAQRLSES
jgi:hypothetical protein